MLLRLCFICVLPLIWAGCPEPPAEEPPAEEPDGPAVGAEGGPCSPEDECFGDLTCASNVCVDLGGSDGNTDGATTGNTDGSSAPDSGSGDGSTDGSTDGTTDGNAVVDSGSSDGTTDGSTDGTEVVDSGFSDGSTDGTTDGTEVVDAGSSDGNGGPGQGEEGGPCGPNGECFGDLTCASSLCVDLGSIDGTTDGTTDGTEVVDAGSSDGNGGPGQGEEGGPCGANGECFGDLTCASSLCVDLGSIDGTTDGTTDGTEVVDAGSADGSGDGATDGTAVVDSGSSDGTTDGTTDGTAVVDAGSSDGSTDGAAVVDSGSSDGSTDGTTDGTEVIDSGSSDGNTDGATDGSATIDAGPGDGGTNGSTDGDGFDAGIACSACPEDTILNSEDCSCTAIDECASNPCEAGYVCENTVGSHNCNVDYNDDCTTNPCQNGGACSDTGVQSFSCDCAGTGFGGTLCNQDADACSNNPCTAGYICETTDQGHNCNVNYNDDCATNPCQNGGSCADIGVQSFECNCSGTGYDGTVCHQDIDECANTNACVANATCTNSLGSFSCACNPGSEDDGFNCVDINECDNFTGCHADATCSNAPNSGDPAICTCMEGYMGDGVNCEISPIIDENGGIVEDQGIILEFEEGSITDDDGVEITITETGITQIPGYILFSPVYAFGPAGISFAQPVTVTLPFDGDAERAAIFWSRADGNGYDRLGGFIDSTTEGDYVAVTQVNHFSEGFVGDGIEYEEPTDLSTVSTNLVHGRTLSTCLNWGCDNISGGSCETCMSSIAAGECIYRWDGLEVCPDGSKNPYTICRDAGLCYCYGSQEECVEYPASLGLFFTVEDAEGRPVTTLGTDDFVVKENGAPISSESVRTLLPTDGYRVFVTLALDMSSSAQAILSDVVGGAKMFLSQLQANSVPAYVSILVFAGDEEPTLWRDFTLNYHELALTDGALDELLSSPPNLDTGATNLHGALISGFDQLQVAKEAFEIRNDGGAFATGHLVLFTDGLDTASYHTAQEVRDANQSTLDRLWVVGLEGADYDPVAMHEFDAYHVTTSPSVDELERDLGEAANLIAGQVQAIYFMGYCSPKRNGTHTVSVEVSNSEHQNVASLEFDASPFTGGCNEELFATTCDGKDCGGAGCGACDDRLAQCSDNSCLAFNSTDCDLAALPEGATTFVNPMSYEQDITQECDEDWIFGAEDNCPFVTSQSLLDYDDDGQGDDCDNDDDNDDIDDDADDCAQGHTGWTSSAETDHDSDGCQDTLLGCTEPGLFCNENSECSYIKSGIPDWEWQGCPAGQSGENCTGSAQSKSHTDAVSYCEDLEWGGFDDWVLPNIDQIRSLITGCAQTEYGSSGCPITHQCSYSVNDNCTQSICSTPGCSNLAGPRSDGCYLPADLPGDCSWFWSSSLSSSSTAYAINFVSSDVSNGQLDNWRRVRCVRSRDLGDLNISFDGGIIEIETGTCEDPDDDNDGCPDETDDQPLIWAGNHDGDQNPDDCDPDNDNDGIMDDADSCETGDIQWVSNASTDNDSDGCQDSSTEDDDDDNDGVLDTDDMCPQGATGWLPGPDTDPDADGCQDYVLGWDGGISVPGEDTDYDNDGVANEDDGCPQGATGWLSGGDTDHDGDGCQDGIAGEDGGIASQGEDLDDDNDGVSDEVDFCPQCEVGQEIFCYENETQCTFARPTPPELEWQTSQSYGTYESIETDCNYSSWAGFTDWRLPTIDELGSLIMGCPGNSCPINQGPTNGCYWPTNLPGTCGSFWSSTGSYSTILFFDSGEVDVVNFSRGQVSTISWQWPDNSPSAYVRCVRDRLFSAGHGDGDGDGVNNENDLCPQGTTDWVSSPETDHDSDGCQDEGFGEDGGMSFQGEDLDDDNDGIADENDQCPQGATGWTPNSNTDNDADGCQDSSTEDGDDDNDGVADENDQCPQGATGWLSGPETDHDGDGCQDTTSNPDGGVSSQGEDLDDDNDGVLDDNDQCPQGATGWTSNPDTDHDGDGCQDAILGEDGGAGAQGEDLDDDNDGVVDDIDACPQGVEGLGQDSDNDGCKEDGFYCQLNNECVYLDSNFELLMWQGCPAGQSGEDCTGGVASKNHADAVSYCEELEWGGFDDWELPNIDQLRSLLTCSAPDEYGNSECSITHQCSYSVEDNCTQSSCSGCNPGDGTGSSDGCYLPADLPGACYLSFWSSSLESASIAFSVSFEFGGSVYGRDLGYDGEVRCVRSRP